MLVIAFQNALLAFFTAYNFCLKQAKQISSTLMLCCMLALPTMVYSEPLNITLAAEDGWPPFADEFGRGISHHLIEQAFKEVDVVVSTIVVPYTRALVMTDRGSVNGVFNVTKEQSTVKRFVFGQEPLFTVKASFFFAKEHPANVNDKWHLPIGSVVGIIDGYEYGDEFIQLIEKRQLRITKVNSQRQLINLLLVGRIDTAIMFDMVADVYIEQMGVAKDINAEFNNHTSEIFVAFSKQDPRAKQWSTLLDKGLQILKQQGHYQQLLVPLD
ncbi:substrate-binding periplasmic protein [Shewanella metallivivens]|uniref:Transporter substrate-binding domain-containing protein n=2 Tax=Shewanella TaxID=22 RepID=A0ABT5TMY0_9GAMM|nr:transporter substrate-binding domain-containing protein [Shewanella metallivivens]MDD8058786.1 transporter substrate-binding domain-containing protein [Shewanella metallivivens]